jgi:hypothetical protein
MASPDELINILRETLRDRSRRPELIDRFQGLVWHGPAAAGDEAGEIFADLAYDLDFYEQDPKARSEDPSYYGDERLEEEIREALRKLGVAEEP